MRGGGEGESDVKGERGESGDNGVSGVKTEVGLCVFDDCNLRRDGASGASVW